MDRNFLMLGLKEDATKEQVKAAYARRLVKYKSADYEDDPEYVRRKIAELNAVYEKAYRMAGEGGLQTESEAQYPKKRSLHAEREKERKRSAEEKGRQQYREKKKEAYVKKRQRMEDEETHPLQRLAQDVKERLGSEKEGSAPEKNCKKEMIKPDLSALKHRAERLRDTMKENIRINSEYEAEIKGSSSSSDTANALNQDGKSESEAAEKSKMQSWGSIIGVLITVVTLMFTMCDNNLDVNYSDDGWSNGAYVMSDYQEEDWNTLLLGEEAAAVIWELDFYSDVEESDDDGKKLRNAADRFAELYTSFDTIDGLCAYLYENVGAFPVGELDDLTFQIDEALCYYGFPQASDVYGYINPYTGKAISNRTEYLRYLNRYYREELALRAS